MSIGDAERARLDALFSAIDAMDLDRFLACLTEDAEFRFGSAPPVHGRTAINEAVGGFFASNAGLTHRLDKTLSSGDTLVCEGEVTYTRHDGSRITLPFANVFETEGDLISHYKIYADVGPLYEG